jgi:site-specific DNA-methyltransferase (adenine-specific)
MGKVRIAGHFIFFESMIEIDNIYNEDCLEGMQRIPDGSVDAVICDLPYGTTANKWDSVIPLDKLWAEYRRIVKKGAPIVLFAQTPFDKVLGCSNLDWLKYEWIWEKPKASGFLQAKFAPLKAHENILVFMSGGSKYNPQGLIYRPHYNTRKSKNGRCSNYGDSYGYTNYSEYDNYPRSVLYFAHDTDNLFHPTQKPVDLLRYLVLTYTNEGGGNSRQLYGQRHDRHRLYQGKAALHRIRT